jgi:hypothetical protein
MPESRPKLPEVVRSESVIREVVGQLRAQLPLCPKVIDLIISVLSNARNVRVTFSVSTIFFYQF